MSIRIRFMRRQDIPQVKEIDREAFPTEWPPTNFIRELDNKMAYYITAYEPEDKNPQPDPAPPEVKKRPGLFNRIRILFWGSRIDQAECEDSSGTIIGYAGMWIMADEAHITSIASHKDHRHQGIGEVLLISLIELAIAKRARIVTLEVRVSNKIAQNLYYKFGFDKLGVRKAYYLDNKEDAVIMSTEYIGSPSFKEKFEQVKEDFYQKWGTFADELSI